VDDGLVEIALARQRTPEIVVRLGIVRTDCERARPLADGLIEAVSARFQALSNSR
jgi:hypothetical protein